MTSLIAKRFPPGAQASQGTNKVLYTIHETRSRNPYLANTYIYSSAVKSSIVGFRNKTDATIFSNILNSHRNQHGEWLKLDCDNKRSIDLYLRIQPNINPYDFVREMTCPDSLYLQQWDETQLSNYCVKYLFDLLIMTKNDNNSSFKGVLHQLEYKHSLALESFERRFTEQ